jgi:hypothetical protein
MDHLRAALAVDASLTHGERLLIEKATTLLQSVHATREKQNQAAQGQNPAMQAVARALGG